MFTGLIEKIGKLKPQTHRSEATVFQVVSPAWATPLQLGESIAVDGVCVTVESNTPTGFNFTASAETLQRSTLGEKKSEAKVHLERALSLSDRLGGHIVQGHIDGVGQVRQIHQSSTGAELWLWIPVLLRKYVVEKGSLAVQGVSLTVAHRDPEVISLVIIPETLRRTYLGELRVGDRVNLEVDLIAKYVESFLRSKGSGLQEDQLRGWGF